MKSLLYEAQIVSEIAENMLAPKRCNYQEDYIANLLAYKKHLEHLNFYVRNGFGEKLNASLFFTPEASTGHCIIYLHGFGSDRLEGVTLLSTLPKQFALCCFDFSGSGKSEGNLSTYGYKQHQDINCIMGKLKQMGYTKFILWGRSMGAVASLLFTCRHKDPAVIFQVLDSPFCSFQNIASYFAQEAMNLPQLFVNFGIDVLKEHFKTHEFSPFQINIAEIAHNCQVPSLFVYSQSDKMILPSNTMTIIKHFNRDTHYEKLLIEEGHNKVRKRQTLKNIFVAIQKHKKAQSTVEKKKTKRGIHEIICSQMTPKSNRTTEVESHKTKMIQYSLNKNFTKKNKGGFFNFEETTDGPFCFGACRR